MHHTRLRQSIPGPTIWFRHNTILYCYRLRAIANTPTPAYVNQMTIHTKTFCVYDYIILIWKFHLTIWNTTRSKAGPTHGCLRTGLTIQPSTPYPQVSRPSWLHSFFLWIMRGSDFLNMFVIRNFVQWIYKLVYKYVVKTTVVDTTQHIVITPLLLLLR